MKYSSLLIASCLTAWSVSAEVIPFALSPAGTSAATGLSPANEVPAVVTPSEGSGGEILSGITFDTETSELSFAIGYGSVALFTDLTGPATGAHIHGPATVNEVIGVIHNFITAGQHLAAGDPAKGGVIIGTVILEELEAADLLAGLYYVNIHTALNPTGEIRGQLIPLSNAAPTITCAEPVQTECATPDGATVNVSVEVADADGDELTVVWTIDGVEYQTDTVPATVGGTAATVHFTGQFGFGTHDVVVSVTDGSAEPVTCSTVVTVVDTLPPEVTHIALSQTVLWPPNHKMVPITVDVHATDSCGPVFSRIVSITSNEPVNGIGDGNTAPDWRITGRRTAELRAERSGRGNGRIYTLTIETVDHLGQKVLNSAEVRVPHDMGGEIRIPGGSPRGPKQIIGPLKGSNGSKKTATAGTAANKAGKTSSAK
jgi:hypothetical protein